jgi:hypothetical protein
MSFVDDYLKFTMTRRSYSEYINLLRGSANRERISM